MSSILRSSKTGFAAQVGREDLVQELLQQVDAGRAHALVLLGPKGSGRKQMAHALARYLLCEAPQGQDSCGVCPSCRYTDAKSHPDLRWILPDEKALIRVDLLRKEVLADLPYYPQLGEHKVYVIAGEALNEQGQNALLKSLEDPPSYVRFILSLERIDQLLPTLLSRVQVLAMDPLPDLVMEKILKEAGLASAQLPFFVAAAAGVPGRALTMAKDQDHQLLREASLAFFFSLDKRRELKLLTSDWEFFQAQKAELPRILDILQSAFRDALVLSQEPEAKLINADARPRFRDFVARREKALGVSLAPRMAACDQALRELRRQARVNTSYEMMINGFLLKLQRALRAKPERDEKGSDK